jgi:zinc transporter 5/7
MASSYALPPLPIHSHHGHVHPHSHGHSQSHSTSPGRAFAGNTSRSLRSGSSSSQHMHSASESSVIHSHEPYEKHNHDRITRITSPSSSSIGFVPMYGVYEEQKVDHRRPISHMDSRESLHNPNILPHNHSHNDHHDHDHSYHDHSHHDHHDHDHHDHEKHEHGHGHSHNHKGHNHSISADPRSKFTTFLLPMFQKYPLLHTIMAEKDSRRIFYFMR